MRTARYKTIQSKKQKGSYGIARQKEMLRIVERRLTQVDVIRDALKDTNKEPESITIRWHGKDEKIEHPFIWLAVYEDVEQAGDIITRELLHRRFSKNESYWKTCDALYLSHSMYYSLLRDITYYALALAVSSGIVDPRPVNEQEE